ncbi:MAG: alcohol dehydrogenase catalytic domain-containing protein [Candidatus Firestonebacteria bacterium]|nr:alcohol dehydrogenase catalytic domain-containing protein [Candidatus Firestonebacteria bacterium]
MRVAVYYNNQDIRIEDQPIPKICKGEILVKVLASGICGTDLMEWYRIKKAPRILGHEITGEIIESKTIKFKIGQRVFVSHHVPCNKCRYCRSGNHTACGVLHQGNYDPGGYSEFVRVPKINVNIGTYILPKNVSFEQGTMIEPLACVIRGQRIINIKKNQIVLVFGCGVSGLLNIKLAKLNNAKVIAVDINKYRLKKAKEYGADEIVNANKIIDIKADRIIICTGAIQAIEQAFNCIDKKGIILLFAIPDINIKIPTVDFWRNELTITSSYGAAPIDIEESLKLIKNNKIDVLRMITHIIPLEKIQEGFKIASDARESLKVVLIPFQLSTCSINIVSARLS